MQEPAFDNPPLQNCALGMWMHGPHPLKQLKPFPTRANITLNPKPSPLFFAGMSEDPNFSMVTRRPVLQAIPVCRSWFTGFRAGCPNLIWNFLNFQRQKPSPRVQVPKSWGFGKPFNDLNDFWHVNPRYVGTPTLQALSLPCQFSGRMQNTNPEP